MEIVFPSSSASLKQPPTSSGSANISAVQPELQQPNNSTTQSQRNHKTTASNQNFRSFKLRQSKSRNGCMTCKKKRIKCDETKPTCGQCEKREVECEGYKKDYKWRPFGEHAAKQSRAGKSRGPQNVGVVREPSTRGPAQSVTSLDPSILDEGSLCLSDLQPSSTIRPQTETLTSTRLSDLSSPRKRFSLSRFDPLPVLSSGFSPSDLDLPSPPLTMNDRISEILADADAGADANVDADADDPFTSTTNPYGLADSLLLDGDLGIAPDPSDLFSLFTHLPLSEKAQTTDHRSSSNKKSSESSGLQNSSDQDRMTFPAGNNNRPLSPAESASSSESSESTNLTLSRAPLSDPSSPDMLTLRFHKETCGILSIKDGPSENPWRTLIWNMAKGSDALYHALLAMAALHGASSQPQLRAVGMAHTTKSISALLVEMHKVSLYQTLATALALALGQTWYHKNSTGMEHLRGAKKLLISALAKRQESLQLGQLTLGDAKRLKFLSNTYVYLYAIACLTSSEEHDSSDLDASIHAVNEPMDDGEHEIDPMMGCATTLFPLLGKVASLIQRVRKTSINSLTIISEANELKEQLLQWELPDMGVLEQPEDPSIVARHVLLTAEAYRRAILLHLESAVIELSSESPHQQAMAILTMLATTPLSSRTLIIQIFPLLIGSCEMTSADDRQWVTRRWEAMMKRLAIVNVTSCWEVVKEVWDRRDRWVEAQAQRIPPRLNRKTTFDDHSFKKVAGRDLSCSENVADDEVDTRASATNTNRKNFNQTHRSSLTSSAAAEASYMPRLPHRRIHMSMHNEKTEYTVRGHLHWLSVMSDWGWEVFL